MPRLLPAAVFAVALASLPALADQRITITPLKAPSPPLGEATFPNGRTLPLNMGYGSAAFRAAGDPEGVIWTVTDRGPNIDCGEAKETVGLTEKELCGGDRNAKIFPQPAFVPTIHKLQIATDGAVTVLATLPLRDRSGRPVTGLPNPLKAANTEGAFDTGGKALPFDPSGLDSEALVRLADGSFWIGEEYGSSILEVAPDGTIRRRLVPRGIDKDLSGAEYDVVPALPAIVAKRQLNRGIENLALSPDEAFLYVLMQSPLANPDAAAYRASANVRLWKIERASGTVVSEYVYRLDDPATFRADNAGKAQKQNDVRLSEMVAVGPDRLLVLERINKTTKLYLVDLSSGTPVPASYDETATMPSLEQLSVADLGKAGIRPLAKSLILDSDDFTGFPAKVEGLARLSERELIMVSDSDFGVTGAGTAMLRVTFAEPVLK
ncbi:esterase-like activity of phytase family protein [Chelatococcus sp. SYSU_G07232]|uniref:Esterase-like activity of phytase family protein n=1 Tax=Chelatococcus albus TaxID=3047466 RepID=A0ABT7AK13_9HYPH|nr:esterase-like activity of phytase family protein [Chelatococcus sp. SYSU_G07232]MDJ1159725.1 esterase-like activity of phytase family protein [Chelatococcus sp. SYSU_G07232]